MFYVIIISSSKAQMFSVSAAYTHDSSSPTEGDLKT